MKICILVIKNIYFTRLARQLYYIALAIINLIFKFAPHPLISLIILKLIGQNISWSASIHRGLYIFSLKPRTLSIGDRVIINPNVKLDNRGYLIIENDVSISSHTSVFSYQHDHSKISRPTQARKTLICSGAFIYSNCIVLPGSVIGKCTVIGAGSVIRGFTEPSALYSGNPAVLVLKDFQKQGRNEFYNYAFVP